MDGPPIFASHNVASQVQLFDKLFRSSFMSDLQARFSTGRFTGRARMRDTDPYGAVCVFDDLQAAAAAALV